MIYRVVLDDTIDIHTSNIDCMLLNPSLELEMNSAGSFKFTLPPTHSNWDDVKDKDYEGKDRPEAPKGQEWAK